ncbi:MAG: hypothetical protein HUU60_09205 [Armatimonadetes bacterium]|nr:hypothetical protein [Armatimonadota bacterium]
MRKIAWSLTLVAATSIVALAFDPQIKLGGWMVNELKSSRTTGMTSGNIDTLDFLTRNVRINLDATVSEKSTVRISSDVDSSSFLGSFVLQDAYLDKQWSETFRLQAGQHLVPFSQDALTDEVDRWSFDRNIITDRTLGGNPRDIGVTLTGTGMNGEDRGTFYYGAGVYNGSGPNAPNDNDEMDFLGFVGYNASNWRIGGSFMTGDHNVAGNNRKRDRWSVDGNWNWNNIWVRGQYAAGQGDMPTPGFITTTDVRGYFGEIGTTGDDGKWAAWARFSSWDPDTSAGSNNIEQFQLGFGYQCAPNIRTSIAWERYDDKASPGHMTWIAGRITSDFR